jgi:hypothetical protein
MSDPTLTIFDQLVDEQQKALIASFEDRHATIAGCGDLMKTTISTLRDRGWNQHESLWNAALFLNTVSYDLSIGLLDLVYERDNWRRRLIARSLALLLFEIGEDIPSVFGKSFREAATALGASKEDLKKLGAETKQVSAFWSEHRPLLKKIRTIAAAHRDHDAIALHEAIDAIDLFELLALGLKLGAMMNTLGKVTQLIINFTAGVEPPELKTKPHSKVKRNID